MSRTEHRTTITVVTRNDPPSERDEHDRLWTELQERIDLLLNEPTYEPIIPIRAT